MYNQAHTHSVNICTHSSPAFYMAHMKDFAGSEKQLLVNKAAYWDSGPWDAAMFSIFGLCVCVFEAGEACCVGGWAVSASWMPLSRRLAVRSQHLDLVSSCSCVLWWTRLLSSLSSCLGVRLKLASAGGTGRLSCSLFPRFNPYKMQDILAIEGIETAQPDFLPASPFSYEECPVSPTCPHL